MPQVLFTFTYNTETREAAVGGNIEVQAAVQLLQQIAIAEAVKRATSKETAGNGGTASDGEEKDKH